MHKSEMLQYTVDSLSVQNAVYEYSMMNAVSSLSEQNAVYEYSMRMP